MNIVSNERYDELLERCESDLLALVAPVQQATAADDDYETAVLAIAVHACTLFHAAVLLLASPAPMGGPTLMRSSVEANLRAARRGRAGPPLTGLAHRANRNRAYSSPRTIP